MSAPKQRLRGEAHAAIYERFLYSDLTDKAVRLLCVLDRYQNLGTAYPGRATLAERLGCSTDTVDRTLRELEGVGAIVTVTAKRPGGGRPMATYWVWPAVPELDEQTSMDADLQSRTGASTKPQTEGKTGAEAISREQEKGKESKTCDSDESPDEIPTDPARGLEEFWQAYPRRNGRRIGKATTAKLWAKLTLQERRDAYRAAVAYAAFCRSTDTYPKDPERFIRNRLWPDFLESAAPAAPRRNGARPPDPAKAMLYEDIAEGMAQ